MRLKVVVVGQLAVNCYICYDEQTGEAVVIDPGDEAEKIAGVIEQGGLKPKAIMLTHSHFDHTGAVDGLRNKYKIPVALHRDEKALLENLEGVVARPFKKEPVQITPDILLEDNEKYSPFSKGAGFLVIHTPGHTEGGASYYMEELNAVFTGDTLFKSSIGRSDFPTGNHETLIASVKDKLFKLKEETYVYPGHGEASSIGDEIKYNPFFNGEA